MSVSRRPTLETVATRAAVSRQTVSNALNSPHLVRADTLSRVLAAVSELGYRPHGAARQLATNRSRVVGLRLEPTMDGISGALLDRFLHALTEQAQLHGYRVMLFTAADDDAEIAQYSELLDVLQLDAFVLTSTHHADPRTGWLTEHAVPFVTFGRSWRRPDEQPSAPEHAWVDVDGAFGTQAAVADLIGRGHRRIAFIGWPDDSEVGNDRAAGWRRAMLAADAVPAADLDALRARVTDGVEHGAAAAQQLLATAAPTAFVCASDSLALGALVTSRAVGRAATGRGLAVVGFDDTPVARALGMSSVAQPLTEAAARAFALLLAQIQGDHPRSPAPGGQHVLLLPSLVVRDSSD